MPCQLRFFVIPIIIYRLDNEAKRRADAVDVLIHDLLHDSRLARIVQPPAQLLSYGMTISNRRNAYNINILISLSLRRAFRKIDSIVSN